MDFVLLLGTSPPGGKGRMIAFTITRDGEEKVVYKREGCSREGKACCAHMTVQNLSFFPELEGKYRLSAVRMASSNTSLTPSWVIALHSMYFEAPSSVASVSPSSCVMKVSPRS